jgi:hypothetical protein
LQVGTMIQMKVLECTQLANRCGQFLQAWTIVQMKVLECTQFPIDVGNSSKLKHSDRLSSWNAFNCPINVGNSCNFEHPNRLSSKSALNLLIDVENFRQLHFVEWNTCKWQQLNSLATFRSCILGDTTIEGCSNLDLGWNFPPYLVRLLLGQAT